VDPFLEPDSASAADMVTDAAVAVLSDGGVARLTIGAIADRVGVTRQAVNQRWEGPHGARRRIIQVVTVTFGRRWRNWLEPGLMADVPEIALPSSAAECRGVRVWAALTEVARAEAVSGNPDPAAAVTLVTDRERTGVRNRIGWWLGSPLPEHAAAGVCALGHGLRADLAGFDPTFTHDEARAVMRTYLDAMRGGHLA
jgi:AcrR family transcriptional regulator